MMSLRQHRMARLWTLRDLAREAHVTQQTIVNIEHGHRTPHITTMRKISKALGVPATVIAEFAEIINGSEQKTPAPERTGASSASSESAEEAEE